MDAESIKQELRRMFSGKSIFGIWFLRFLFLVDFAFMILIFTDSVFSESGTGARSLELYFGMFFLLELFLRLWSAQSQWRMFFSWRRQLDFFIIISIVSRLFILEDDNFLIHIFGALRVVKCYSIAHMMFKSNDAVTRYKDVIMAFLNLMVFVFMMTTLVYGFQFEKNDGINTYLDALYFTMATLTTTGFGDVVLQGTDGKLLAVIIMIFGVGLFLKLVHDIFRPGKVFSVCDSCGLTRHEPDASHCKHCGEIVFIQSGGGDR